MITSKENKHLNTNAIEPAKKSSQPVLQDNRTSTLRSKDPHSNQTRTLSLRTVSIEPKEVNTSDQILQNEYTNHIVFIQTWIYFDNLDSQNKSLSKLYRSLKNLMQITCKLDFIEKTKSVAPLILDSNLINDSDWMTQYQAFCILTLLLQGKCLSNTNIRQILAQVKSGQLLHIKGILQYYAITLVGECLRIEPDDALALELLEIIKSYELFSSSVKEFQDSVFKILEFLALKNVFCNQIAEIVISQNLLTHKNETLQISAFAMLENLVKRAPLDQSLSEKLVIKLEAQWKLHFHLDHFHVNTQSIINILGYLNSNGISSQSIDNLMEIIISSTAIFHSNGLIKDARTAENLVSLLINNLVSEAIEQKMAEKILDEKLLSANDFKIRENSSRVLVALSKSTTPIICQNIIRFILLNKLLTVDDLNVKTSLLMVFFSYGSRVNQSTHVYMLEEIESSNVLETSNLQLSGLALMALSSFSEQEVIKHATPPVINFIARQIFKEIHSMKRIPNWYINQLIFFFQSLLQCPELQIVQKAEKVLIALNKSLQKEIL